jgi:hypothetical protein
LRLKNPHVLSFGSKGDFSFERAVHLLNYRSTIHVFDPFYKLKVNTRPLAYHNFGLAGTTRSRFMTLPNIMSHLNHSGIVDVLKIDIEGDEFEALNASSNLFFLRDHVVQLLVEVHFVSRELMERLALSLHQIGFIVFHEEPNLAGFRAGCVEMAFVNSNFFL